MRWITLIVLVLVTSPARAGETVIEMPEGGTPSGSTSTSQGETSPQTPPPISAQELPGPPLESYHYNTSSHPKRHYVHRRLVSTTTSVPTRVVEISGVTPRELAEVRRIALSARREARTAKRQIRDIKKEQKNQWVGIASLDAREDRHYRRENKRSDILSEREKADWNVIHSHPEPAKDGAAEDVPVKERPYVFADLWAEIKAYWWVVLVIGALMWGLFRVILLVENPKRLVGP